jgi:XisH protein
MVEVILQKKYPCQELSLLSYTGQRIYDHFLAMDKDLFHNQLKTALLKDDWLITHDPFEIRISEAVRRQICLGTDNMLAAQRNLEKIAVEIKSFTSDSGISEFHRALGQYLNYAQALEDREPDRVLYLAVPCETYNDFFQLPFVQKSIKFHAVNLVIYDLVQKEIKQWINFNNIDK